MIFDKFKQRKPDLYNQMMQEKPDMAQSINSPNMVPEQMQMLRQRKRRWVQNYRQRAKPVSTPNALSQPPMM